MKPRIVAGDPEITRLKVRESATARRFHERTGPYQQVSCSQCGRMVLLARDGQRLAVGDPVQVAELDKRALAENRIAKKPGSEEIRVERHEVWCMWCAWADQPELLRTLDAELARARTAR